MDTILNCMLPQRTPKRTFREPLTPCSLSSPPPRPPSPAWPRCANAPQPVARREPICSIPRRWMQTSLKLPAERCCRRLLRGRMSQWFSAPRAPQPSPRPRPQASQPLPGSPPPSPPPRRPSSRRPHRSRRPRSPLRNLPPRSPPTSPSPRSPTSRSPPAGPRAISGTASRWRRARRSTCECQRPSSSPVRRRISRSSTHPALSPAVHAHARTRTP
jgi:hypothetical protein